MPPTKTLWPHGPDYGTDIQVIPAYLPPPAWLPCRRHCHLPCHIATPNLSGGANLKVMPWGRPSQKDREKKWHRERAHPQNGRLPSVQRGFETINGTLTWDLLVVTKHSSFPRTNLPVPSHNHSMIQCPPPQGTTKHPRQGAHL